MYQNKVGVGDTARLAARQAGRQESHCRSARAYNLNSNRKAYIPPFSFWCRALLCGRVNDVQEFSGDGVCEVVGCACLGSVHHRRPSQ